MPGLEFFRWTAIIKRSLFVFLVLLPLSPACSNSGTPIRPAREVIAVVPKGTLHLFWKTIEAGARAAGVDLGVEILWKGPLKENDRAAQIALVEQLVTQNVSGIVLAPLDDTALLRPVRAASQRGVPVLIFDTGLKGTPGRDFISLVATDNYAGGKLAAQRLTDVLGGTGTVGLLRYQVGSGSTTDREEGFLDGIREVPGFRVSLENQYGGVTVGETLQKSEEILDILREMQGIFCPTEPTTYGVMVALRKHSLAGNLKLIGFDSSEELIRGLESGEIDALVLQDPWRMAYLAVQTMVRHLRGESVPLRIDTQVRIITKPDLDDPEIKLLLGLVLEAREITSPENSEERSAGKPFRGGRGYRRH
jgi:ribose transport system substrate-binding protein